MNEFLDYLEYVKNQLMGIGIVDIVDILIVALLVYWVFKFVRERRAARLLVGLGMLGVLLLLSNIIGMRALSFILTNVFSVGIVALVIVFQPELRSALEKVGEGGSLRNFKGKLENESIAGMRSAISETCYAAESFSQSKTGALIVFERSTKLGDFIRTGTIVDGLTSSFLFRNIFFNKSPLHDGAVIMREGRIYSAGCFLPLSTNSGIVQELGTRHRAAIGMSENSDAVVLVVSEETGTISVAVNGELQRDFTRATLECYLSKLLIKEEKVKGKFFGRNGDGRDDE